MFHDPALHPQLAQGVGLEKLLVQLVHPGSPLSTGRRHPEGMGGGVGKAEAAGIRAQAHIDAVQHLRLPGRFHKLQHVIDHLGAGGAVRVHQLQVGKGGGRAVVVNAQPHPAEIPLGVVRQHPGRGHIGGDDGIVLSGLLHGKALQHPAEPAANAGIHQHMGGLAQTPQPQAQRRGAAQGIPVGADMGENHIVVMVAQESRRLNPRQALRHGLPPES